MQQKNGWGEEHLQAHLLLDYGTGWIEDSLAGCGIWVPEERVYIVRDSETENAAGETLKALGLRREGGGARWRLALKPMPRVARELLHSGWHVEAAGKVFRTPGATKVEVSSGIDWFELRAQVEYGDRRLFVSK